MLKRNKFKIGLLIVTFATTLFAPVVMAQSAGPTTADIKGVNAKITALQEAKAGANNKETDAVIAARKEAMQACANVGKEAQAITQNPVQAQTGGKVISTLWTSGDTCNFGIWQSATGGTDLMAQTPYDIRHDKVVIAPAGDPVEGLWAKISAGGTFTGTDVSTSSFAETVASWANLFNPVTWILAGLFYTLNSFMLSAITLVGVILNNANTQWLVSAFPPYVDKGWSIVLSFMNMVFILALIVISIGMILRRESFGNRRLVLKLVLMALLINFSKVIAITLIDASNAVMKIFASQWIDYGAYWTSELGTGVFSLDVLRSSSASQLVAEWMRLLALGLILASYGGMAVLIILRYIGLSVLVLLSPAAYALNIIPNTSQAWRMWWGYFIKYLIWGPVAYFFLYLGQIFIKAGTTITGNVTFDGLYIAIFFWVALYTAKRAGMIGADTVFKYTDKVWRGTPKTLMRYGLRGTAVKHAGMAAEKVPGLSTVGKGLKLTGETWEKGAQKVEGFPGAVSKGLKMSEDKYQKGVASAQKSMWYRAGLLEDKEMVGNYKDAYRLVKDKINSKDGWSADDTELISSMNRKGLGGAFEAFKNEWESGKIKPELKEEIEDAFAKKMGANLPDIKPGSANRTDLSGRTHSLFNELPMGPDGKPLADYTGYTGWRYRDPNDPTKGHVLEAENERQNGQLGKHKKAVMNANYAPPELEKMDAVQRADYEKHISGVKDKAKVTESVISTFKDDPNIMQKWETLALSNKNIYNPNEYRHALDEVDNYNGVGPRVDISQSFATNTGRVVINSAATREWAAKTGENLDGKDWIVDKEDFGEFAKVLQEKGGISKADLGKLQMTVNAEGSISVQSGVAKNTKSYLENVVGKKAALEIQKMARRQEGIRKNHENLHRLAALVKKSNTQLYQDVVGTITGFDKKNFDELKKEIKSNPAYVNYNDAEIAEEIWAEPKFRKRLNQETQRIVSEKMQPAYQMYQAIAKTTIKNIRAASRADVLASTIIDRAPELSTEVDHVRRVTG